MSSVRDTRTKYKGSFLALLLCLATAAQSASDDGPGGVAPSLGPGGDPSSYRVPWFPLDSERGVAGMLAVYWFPSTAEQVSSSALWSSRDLVLWSSRCIGLGQVGLGNETLRTSFGVRRGEVAVMVTDSGGEIARTRIDSAAIDVTLEEMIQRELEARERILGDTLTAAKQLRRSDRAGAVSLYRQVYAQRCLFPSLGQRAARELRKLDQTVEVDTPWMEEGASQIAEPVLGRRVGERIERSLSRGIQAEAARRWDEAGRHYEAARAIDRGDATPLRYLGEVHRVHLDGAEVAATLFERILAMPADALARAVALHGLGTFDLAAGDMEAGLQRLRESLAEYPLALTYQTLADHWRDQGDADRAEIYGQRATDLKSVTSPE